MREAIVRPLLAYALVLPLLAPAANADSAPPAGRDGPPRTDRGLYGGRSGRLGVGIGMIHSSEPYRGFDRKIVPIPMLTYFDRRFTWTGPQASYRFAEWQDYSLHALLRYDFSGYEEGDSDVLGGMSDRDGTVEAGVRLDRALGRRLGFRISVATDILGRHEGQEIHAAVRYRRRWGRLMLVPALGVRWQSRDKADYYFGVRGSEATPERPPYGVGPATSWELGAAVLYLYSDRVTFIAFPRLDFLAEPIRDSPIVSDNLMLSGFLGFSYSL